VTGNFIAIRSIHFIRSVGTYRNNSISKYIGDVNNRDIGYRTIIFSNYIGF
jgi:hypothetical protein